MGSLRKFVKKMSESGVNPIVEDEHTEPENKMYYKANFTTPQLKPSSPSDLDKNDFSMSVGRHVSTRKYSENTFDLVR